MFLLAVAPEAGSWKIWVSPAEACLCQFTFPLSVFHAFSLKWQIEALMSSLETTNLHYIESARAFAKSVLKCFLLWDYEKAVTVFLLRWVDPALLTRKMSWSLIAEKRNIHLSLSLVLLARLMQWLQPVLSVPAFWAASCALTRLCLSLPALSLHIFVMVSQRMIPAPIVLISKNDEENVWLWRNRMKKFRRFNQSTKTRWMLAFLCCNEIPH